MTSESALTSSCDARHASYRTPPAVTYFARSFS